MKKDHISNSSGQRVQSHLIRKALGQLKIDYKSQDKTIDVLIADDKTLRDLNHRFRGIEATTDVLSFPAPDWNCDHLGEIAISIQFAVQGAKSRKVSVANELAFLAIHGGLHLLGYDDETDEGRDDMVRRMNRVAEGIGLLPDTSWASQEHEVSGAN